MKDHASKGELTRFSVSMEPDLLAWFDGYVAGRGSGNNRSEAIRDLIRDVQVDQALMSDDAEVVGTITMVFDHHSNDLSERLDAIQHEHFREIVSATHVHLDAHNCLEVIIVRGKSSVVRAIADQLLGTKGVSHGRLVSTMVHAH